MKTGTILVVLVCALLVGIFFAYRTTSPSAGPMIDEIVDGKGSAANTRETGIEREAPTPEPVSTVSAADGEGDLDADNSISKQPEKETKPPTADTSALDKITSTLSEYFEAAFANDTVRATAIAKPGSAVAGQVDDLTQVEFKVEDIMFEVLADESHAVAVSEQVAVEDGGGHREGYLLFFLVKDDSGAWLIEDIDFETGESGSEELDRFLERYPEATYLLQFEE